MPPQSTFGRLQRVELRDGWSSEAADFTPWLAQAENLRLLGETLGMELELEAQERSVGPFRADILCRHVTDGSWVLIENQLERTDHTHLGQLLTYTAGLDAAIIVWVAQSFTEEHRAALDWLNEKTPEELAFFGLEVELWRIGESPPAPKFNVISKPNEWTRTVRRRTRGDSERAQLCHDYWSGVLGALGPSGILGPGARAHRKQDIRFPVGWRDFWLKAYFSVSNRQFGVWVACRGPRWKDNFERLMQARERIEETFGESLEWSERETGASIHRFDYEGDPQNLDDWPRQHALIAEKSEALYRAMEPFVSELDHAEENAEPPA